MTDGLEGSTYLYARGAGAGACTTKEKILLRLRHYVNPYGVTARLTKDTARRAWHGRPGPAEQFPARLTKASHG